MKNLTKKQLGQTENFVKKTLDDFNWTHIQHILYFAKKLAREKNIKKKNVNWQLIYVAILFHDIAKVKNFDLKHHALPGAKIAKKYLTKIKADKKFIDQVFYLVKTHSNPWSQEGKIATSLEAKILYDADMIAHLNPFGIATHFYYLSKKPFRQVAKETNWGLTTAYKTIQTKEGKKLAQPYFAKTKKFLDELAKNLKPTNSFKK